MAARLPRELHPAAWWGWALGVAVAVSFTANPWLLALAVAVVSLVVVARRGSSPWARAFPLYLWLGAFIVTARIVLHILVGLKFGETVVLPLPEVDLPSWAAGIQLGGDVRLEGLLAAVAQGLRLAVMIAAIGAANALANPKRLIRSLPGALHEVGTAVVVSISVAPQLAESVQRVRRARTLRGDASRGLRAVPAVALPVLEDTLERSLLLAAAMDSRGYGRPADRSRAHRRRTTTVLLLALTLVAVGTYGVLDGSTSPLLGAPALALGVALAVVGLWLGGRGATRTTYRPAPSLAPEWLTIGCGLAAAVAFVVQARIAPDTLGMPVTPLAVPALPLLPVVGLLIAALPAFLTPEPPGPARRAVRRRVATPEPVASHG